MTDRTYSARKNNNMMVYNSSIPVFARVEVEANTAKKIESLFSMTDDVVLAAMTAAHGVSMILSMTMTISMTRCWRQEAE